VFVFCLIWLPGVYLTVLGLSKNFAIRYFFGTWLLPVGLLFVGLQPVVSTCMAMTKADVKKYFIELITLSYIQTKQSQQE